MQIAYLHYQKTSTNLLSCQIYKGSLPFCSTNLAFREIIDITEGLWGGGLSQKSLRITEMAIQIKLKGKCNHFIVVQITLQS